MHPDQAPYRALYDAMMEYDGSSLHADVVLPWLRGQDEERRWLDSLRTRAGNPVPPMSPEESCRLYALSRIVELLQLSFAPWGADRPDTWGTATVAADEYHAFMEHLGLERVEVPRFRPFHHEIVSVEQAEDDAAPPEVVREYWAGYRLGPLLICRAGCHVRAGRDHVVKEIAERSTLYWAFARHTRPVADLGQGWGSNSQWRTAFRRDYELDGRLYLNVGAAPAGGGKGSLDPDLLPGERTELLRHRCFVRTPKRHDDRWPYDLTRTEEA